MFGGLTLARNVQVFRFWSGRQPDSSSPPGVSCRSFANMSLTFVDSIGRSGLDQELWQRAASLPVSPSGRLFTNCHFSLDGDSGSVRGRQSTSAWMGESRSGI
jgi:hypothetical protein